MDVGLAFRVFNDGGVHMEGFWVDTWRSTARRSPTGPEGPPPRVPGAFLVGG
jgi:hypothetical protein